MGLVTYAPAAQQGTVGAQLAVTGGLFNQGRESAGTRIIEGLAPDAIRSVSVQLPGGGFRTARVIDNVYTITVPATDRWIFLRRAAGRPVRLRLS
jgi:hypothetical protein